MSYDADLNFVFGYTPKVVFGSNSISDLNTYISEMQLNKAVVVTDGFIAEKTNLVERVQKILGNYLVGVFSGVIPDPSADVVDQGADYALSKDANILISLGGGSAIDTAKGMAVVMTEGGKILDHEGYHALTKPLIPHIAIPTTAGTGSEATLVLVIKHPERNQKTFVGSYFLHPNLAILDPTLTTGLPANMTAATGMDAMCHAVEALISTLKLPWATATSETVTFEPTTIVPVRSFTIILANWSGDISMAST